MRHYKDKYKLTLNEADLAYAARKAEFGSGNSGSRSQNAKPLNKPLGCDTKSCK